MAGGKGLAGVARGLGSRRWLVDGGLLALVTLVGLRGWLGPGYLASPRLEMVPELSIVWMAKQRILEGGPLTEWVPYEFAGFPLVRFLSYPLYDAMAWVSIGTGLALEWLFKAGFILAFVASALAMYALAYELVRRRGAALAAGAIYALFPFHLHAASEAWVHAVFWAVMPLAFLAYERSRSGPTVRARDGLWLGLLLASLPIINSEHTLLLAPFLGIYLLLREGAVWWRDRRQWRAMVGYWALAGGVALGLAAFFVLPAMIELEDVGIHLKHGAESFQSDQLLRDYALSPALLWRAVVRRFGLAYELAQPSVIGHAFWSIAWYPGALALALAALGARRAFRDARLAALLAVLVAAALFILGSWLPGNPFPKLPFLGRLAPFRGMFFFAFGLSLCAAWGMRDLLSWRPWRGAARGGLVVAALVALLLDYWPAGGALTTLPSYLPEDEIAAYRWLAEQGQGFRSWEQVTAHRDAYLRSYGLVYDSRRHLWGYYDNGAPRHMWALYSWGDIPTALELGSTRYIITRPGKAVDAAAAALLEKMRSRGYDQVAWSSESLTILENPAWRPLVTAYRSSALYLGDPEYRALDILPALVEQGVALASGPSDYAEGYGLEDVQLFDHVIVREPWARDAEAAAALREAAGARLVTHQEILEGRPLAPAGKGTQAALSWQRPGPERIIVNVTCQEPVMVMVSEAWYPNWRLTVDGQEQAVWRVNYAYLGARVEAGQHELVFRYEKPWHVWLGYALSGLTLVAVLCNLAIWRKR